MPDRPDSRCSVIPLWPSHGSVERQTIWVTRRGHETLPAVAFLEHPPQKTEGLRRTRPWTPTPSTRRRWSASTISFAACAASRTGEPFGRYGQRHGAFLRRPGGGCCSGAGAALKDDDFVVSHHRGHGHCIAKGRRSHAHDGRAVRARHRLLPRPQRLDAHRRYRAAAFWAPTALSAPASGSEPGRHFLLKASRQRPDLPGVLRRRRRQRRHFHASAQHGERVEAGLAVFLCENNQFALSTRMSDAASIDRHAKSARRSYSMPGETIDGDDALAVYDAVVRDGPRSARRGSKPDRGYHLALGRSFHARQPAGLPWRRRANANCARTATPSAAWPTRPPGQERQIGAASLDVIKQKAWNEIEQAVEVAKTAPEPTVAGVRECGDRARHDRSARSPGRAHSSARECSFGEAIREAIDQEMARDKNVFVLGEDVGHIGGIFAATRGLMEKYGKERVRDTPISEMAIAGAAVGAAITGMRPVADIETILHFVTHMMDPIVNQAAKFPLYAGWRSQGAGGFSRSTRRRCQTCGPAFPIIGGLVSATPAGARRHGALDPYDAKGLLAAAIRDDNPVIFCEHKLDVHSKGPVPAIEYAITIGKADIKRPGKDVTLIATITYVGASAARCGATVARRHRSRGHRSENRARSTPKKRF